MLSTDQFYPTTTRDYRDFRYDVVYPVLEDEDDDVMESRPRELVNDLPWTLDDEQRPAVLNPGKLIPLDTSSMFDKGKLGSVNPDLESDWIDLQERRVEMMKKVRQSKQRGGGSSGKQKIPKQTAPKQPRKGKQTTKQSSGPKSGEEYGRDIIGVVQRSRYGPNATQIRKELIKDPNFNRSITRSVINKFLYRAAKNVPPMTINGRYGVVVWRRGTNVNKPQTFAWADITKNSVDDNRLKKRTGSLQNPLVIAKEKRGRK